MQFSVNRKTGFYSPSEDLLIFDGDGIPFYYRENKGKNQKFNLPIGTYQTEAKIYQLPKPIFYTKPKIKKRYNFSPLPKNGFKISYGENPHKCTVDMGKHTILFDESFRSEPRFVIDFIKYHELGHYRYSGKGQQSEKDCDNFSRRIMLDVGYNPSQIDCASELSLSNDKYGRDRKKESFGYLKTIKAQ